MGRWTAICPAAVYDADPTDLECRNGDFVLRDGSTYYYFCRNLPISGNTHLHAGESGVGLRTVQGALPRVTRITWADNGERLLFSQQHLPQLDPPGDRGIPAAATEALTFNATPFPYGSQLIWRIAVIDTAG